MMSTKRVEVIMLGRIYSRRRSCCMERLILRETSTMTRDKPKVTILGAGGGVGQSLSLLLKMSSHISKLSLYDMFNVGGFAEDMSHINTSVDCKGYRGSSEIEKSLEGSDVVVITAGVARRLGMSRDDLFASNCSIVKDLAEACAIYSQNACIAILTNPVNSMVPVACKTLERLNKFDPKRIFGITTLDVIRTNTFFAEMKKLDRSTVEVPVVGGHAAQTVVPLFSQATPSVKLEKYEMEILTEKVRSAGDHVLDLKASGTSTAATAFAAARFVNSLSRAIRGTAGVVECAYVPSNVYPELKYFASPLELGTGGVTRNLGVGQINEYEATLLSNAKVLLLASIAKGEEFGQLQ